MMKNENNFGKVFENQYSADKNYQIIMNKVHNKKKHFCLRFSFASALAAILIIVYLVNVFGNSERIFVNNLNNEKILIIDTFNNHLSDEYDISSHYPFVEKVTIPSDLDSKEEGVIYLNGNNGTKIHDYVIAYYSKQSIRSVKLAFSNINVLSLINNPIKDLNLKQSRIFGYKIVIAERENFYYVNFRHQNMDFIIETNNLTQSEVLDIVKSIIK